MKVRKSTTTKFSIAINSFIFVAIKDFSSNNHDLF